MSLTSAQTTSRNAVRAVVADRDNEILGRSDAASRSCGEFFAREMQALATGRPAKMWRKLEHATDLPIQAVAP